MKKMSDSNETSTVWITKYALTSTGILCKEVEVCDRGMVVERHGKLPAYYHGEGREWHRTKEAAVDKAKKMRDAKIAALKQQIARLSSLKFEDVP